MYIVKKIHPIASLPLVYMYHVEEVPQKIFKDKVLQKIHSKAGALKTRRGRPR